MLYLLSSSHSSSLFYFILLLFIIIIFFIFLSAHLIKCHLNLRYGDFTRFLGYFQPQEGKPALWELDSDYYLHVSGIGDNLFPEEW